jgi:hypothetical protein
MFLGIRKNSGLMKPISGNFRSVLQDRHRIEPESTQNQPRTVSELISKHVNFCTRVKSLLLSKMASSLLQDVCFQSYP